MFKLLAVLSVISPSSNGAIIFSHDVKPTLVFNKECSHQSTKNINKLTLNSNSQSGLLSEKNTEGENAKRSTELIHEKDHIFTNPEVMLIQENSVGGDDLTVKGNQPQKVVTTVGIPPSKLYQLLGFDKLAGKIQHGKSYTNTISDTEVKYEMVAIPGGKYMRGGSETNEIPKKEIKIDPFWIQKYEISWSQYEIWQFNIDIKSRDKKKYKKNKNDTVADIVSRPTGPYLDMSFGMGKKNCPAICMTQLAAKSYCMWLSAKTGHFYRLATEAEWEYACRAGSTTKYYFGDDKLKINEYGWHYDNTDGDGYKQRGLKKPNAWGLYDMHGNVAEWVLDSFNTDFYKTGSTDNPVCLPAKGKKLNPGVEAPWPNKLYGRVARGGSWNDDAKDLRSASRKISKPEWKMRDPQLPKSVWYHTDATGVGFRIVRAARIPLLKDLSKYWPSKEEMLAIPPR